MFVYQFPGTQIEYLDGKTYNIKTLLPHEEIEEGWFNSPQEAEEASKPKRQPKVKDNGKETSE